MLGGAQDDFTNGGAEPRPSVQPDIDTDLEKNEIPQRETGHLQDKSNVDIGNLNAFLVRFEKTDPDDPKNFNPYLKAWLTFVMGLLAFSGSVGTSIVTPAEAIVARYFEVDLEVTVLMMALFLLGTFVAAHVSLASCAQDKEIELGIKF